MIRLIHGDEAHLFPRETDSVFRARAEVFGKRLGWSVDVVDGRERDRFDAMNPLYLVSIDEETGEPQGSMRLLPTIGPHMLGDCFAPSFPDCVALQAPRIWESTRMCVHPESRAPYTATGARRPTFELMLGMCEVGLMSGDSFFQGVYDRTMTRIYRQTRWQPIEIATTAGLGPLPVYAGLWHVSEATLDAMRAASGIAGSIIEPRAEQVPGCSSGNPARRLLSRPSPISMDAAG